MISEKRKTSRSGTIRLLSSSSEREFVFQHPPEIRCEFCQREYHLLAGGDAHEFLEHILRNSDFSDLVLEIMTELDITVNDIKNGFCGVSLPKKFLRKLRKKEFHVIFEIDRDRYFITFYREKRRFVAINMERIV